MHHVLSFSSMLTKYALNVNSRNSEVFSCLPSLEGNGKNETFDKLHVPLARNSKTRIDGIPSTVLDLSPGIEP